MTDKVASMGRRGLRGLVLGALCAMLAAGAGGCGPARQDCEALCEWWAGYCTAEPKESCMDDCLDAWPEDVDYAMQQCLGSSASSCKGASCCLRFVYEEYYYQTNCL